MTVLAPEMFGRWSQENFLKYMREQFGLDRLIEYGTAEIPETAQVVNPQRRHLEGQIKKQAALLARREGELVAVTLGSPIEGPPVPMHVLAKAQLFAKDNDLHKQNDRLQGR